MARRLAQFNGRGMRGLLVLLTVGTAALGWAPQAGATALTPGDVVVERDGSGGVEALTSSATPVYLNEFAPGGSLAATLALPTTTSGSNKPLVDSGTSTSDGQLTLSGNGECVLTVGYDAPLGLEKVSESGDKAYPRTVAIINKNGEINTTTALTNFANENNARSATSSECTQLWVGGNGTKTTGGVVYVAKPGEATGTQLAETDTNVRQVQVVDGQLYTSADPTKAPSVSIAKWGTGLPTTKGRRSPACPSKRPPKSPTGTAC